ncbi:MAG: AAA family ATPase [Bacillota bacterium]
MSRENIEKIKNNIAKVIVGKDEVVELLLTTLLANGHILIDDVPGMGKTKLANTLARSINSDFKRIQFTPDLQPSDITGIYFYNQKKSEFIFRKGPILSNIVLADEINRAVPRTQASLLEAMEERQLTVEGNLFKIEEPFMVIATQNPVELEGTFPLPEAQLDRFLMKIKIGYPDKDEENLILNRFKKNDPIESLDAVLNKEEIISLREEVKEVKISDDLKDYIVSLNNYTRKNKNLKLGVSPRGSIALMNASLAYAYLKNRDYVLPDDIKYLYPYVVEHRIILSDESELQGISKKEIIRNTLNNIEVPVEGVVNEGA